MNLNSTFLSSTKDLTQEPPRNPDERLGGYVILARALDKCRASIQRQNGEYAFNCPVDNLLFNFKGIPGSAVQKILTTGASDEEFVDWLNECGVHKSPEEIRAWSDQMEEFSFYFVPEKKAWFVAGCKGLGLDPATTTLFEYLEVDDRKRFGLPVPMQDRHP